MSEVYRRQLDAVLFSLNQHALDVANSWVSSLSMLLNEKEHSPTEDVRTDLQAFRDRIPCIVAVFQTDSSLRTVDLLVPAGPNAPDSVTQIDILSVLRLSREKVARLAEFRREQYRKIEPFPLVTGQNSTDHIALVFYRGSELAGIVGLVINDRLFIQGVLLRKLQETAGSEFVLAVIRQGARDPVIATSETPAVDLRQQKAIWLLPGYSLGIRLQGATIEELVSKRASRNMILIFLLDAVLLGGVFVVYRSIRREMELASIKSNFVSNVSHELRTPLALIRMYAETLEMGRLSTEGKKLEYYGTIVRETERLTRLVNNILNFSSMEAGKKQYRFTPVRLNDVVSGVLQTYSVHLKAKGFSPVIELGKAVPVVNADGEAVAEALINILDNAIKYSDREKYLRVRSGVDGGTAYIEVEDHGIGIPAGQQKDIFEMFYRVSTGHGHEHRGTGIGLALVKHIMEAHGGSVVVKSSPGTGSTFRLHFPATEVQNESRRDSHATHSPH